MEKGEAKGPMIEKGEQLIITFRNYDYSSLNFLSSNGKLSPLHTHTL
jgi:hypothetical protein